MSVFTAHYYSPKSDVNRANGLFDFESENRLGSKALEKDARLAMLERYGNKSISWIIDSIKRKKSRNSQVDGQTMLDFREPVEQPKRKKKKGWW